MKIKGKKSYKYKIPLKLSFGGEVVQVEVDPLPINFRNRLIELFPAISPPRTGFAKDKNGRLLKDEFGKFIDEYDMFDGKFQLKEAKLELCQTVYTIYQSFKSCIDIEFDSKEEAFENKEDFVMSVAKELNELGFTAKQLLQIASALSEENSIDAIEAEKKN